MKKILRKKMQTNGIQKMQGVFRFSNEIGFPMSITYDICKENGIEIDWIEALLEAARMDKFDSTYKEIEMLVPHEAQDIKYLFGLFVMADDVPGELIEERAEFLYQKMWENNEENYENSGK